MKNTHYSLFGTVDVPEGKKNEANEYVSRLLELGGIRKTESIVLDGRMFTVVDLPKPNKDGVMEFDYSIFEKRKREINTYDTGSCILSTPDRGDNEFGMIMNCIMYLLEFYSNGKCYLMKDDQYMKNTEAYLFLLKKFLKKDFRLNHRAKTWDMLFFSHENKEKISSDCCDIFQALPLGYVYVSTFQICSLMNADLSGFEQKLEDITDLTWEDIKTGKVTTHRSYLYQTFQILIQENQEHLHKFLKTLLEQNLEDRKKMTEEKSPYGEMAEISLYEPASLFVSCYAVALGKEFWDAWNDLGLKKGYQDILDDEIYKPESYIPENNFYSCILRDNEDEFLEFWNEDNLLLSDGMKQQIENWVERFQNIEVPSEMNVEQFLADILYDLDKVWDCRYVDKAFVLDCLEHKKETAYQKMLVLLREFMDEKAGYFPELTKNQALRWIVAPNVYRQFRIKISAFISIMGNHEARNHWFGF